MEASPDYWLSRPRENQFFSRRANGLQHPSKDSSSSLKVNIITWISMTTVTFSEWNHSQTGMFWWSIAPCHPKRWHGSPLHLLMLWETTQQQQGHRDHQMLCPTGSTWALLMPNPPAAGCTGSSLDSLFFPFTFPPSKVKLPISGSGWLILFSENLDNWTMLLKSFIVYWT